MKIFTVYFICLIMIVLCSSTFAQIEWEKNKDNPNWEPGSPGEWDANLGPGCLLFDGKTYHQWYIGTASGTTYKIGYATSPDGIIWTKDTQNNPVLDIGDPGTWEDTRLSNPYVLYIDEIYHMWYAASDGEHFRIGYATSPDGIDWTKYENNPVMESGAPGSWTENGVFSPCVRFDGTTYHMWFAGESNSIVDNIGYATSPDGITWTQYPGNPVIETGSPGKWDQRVVQGPRVIYDGYTYHMWFTGANTAGWWRWRIGYAISPDGTNWTKYADNPVLRPTAGSWDSQFVGFGNVVLDTIGDQYRMWYGGGDSDWDAHGGYATAPVTILHVPGHYATIQEGIDAADSADVVLVEEGTYYENINFKGKAITVASHYWFDGDTSHISKTVIDGSQPSNPDSGSVVYFVSGEDTNAVLSGFTIAGGSGTKVNWVDEVRWGGAGIFCQSGGKIINNIIRDNEINVTVDAAGGVGITAGWLGTEYVVIEGNTITSNSIVNNGFAAGCGITLFGNGRIINNIITENSVTAHNDIGAGGGIACFGSSENFIFVNITGNQIRNNSVHADGSGSIAAYSGGLHFVYTNGSISNNQVMNNSVVSSDDAYGGGIFVNYTESSTIANNFISNNTVQGNGDQVRGGGMNYSSQDVSGNTKMYKNLIVYNQAISGDGGGISFGSEITQDIILVNNTIAFNRAGNSAGGIITRNNLVGVMYNTIVWGNEADLYPQIYPTDGSTLVASYCDIQGSFTGTGNIDADPLFTDTINYYLSEQSPCIDSGHDSCIFNDNEIGGMAVWPAMGTSRNDMGAYGGNSDSIYKFVTAIDNHDRHNNYIPLNYVLNQNYPNPFNPSTTIEFTLPKSEFVELKVFNILGKEVSTLVSKKLNQGNHTYKFNGKNLASGIYYYRIEAGNFVETRKMIYLK